MKTIEQVKQEDVCINWIGILVVGITCYLLMGCTMSITPATHATSDWKPKDMKYMRCLFGTCPADDEVRGS